jgi:hypothetical protein
MRPMVDQPMYRYAAIRRVPHALHGEAFAAVSPRLGIRLAHHRLNAGRGNMGPQSHAASYERLASGLLACSSFAIDRFDRFGTSQNDGCLSRQGWCRWSTPSPAQKGRGHLPIT